MLKLILAGAVVALSGLTPATAQIARTDLADAAPPAEFPPASFTARQYVDSTGCVYVRAGQGATSIWVPRVTGDRKALCGFRPTLNQTAASTAPVIADPAPTVQVADATAPAPSTQPMRQSLSQTQIAGVSRPVPAAAPVGVAAPMRAGSPGRYVPPVVTASLTPQPYGSTRMRPVATVPRKMPTVVAPMATAPARYVPPVVTSRVSYGGGAALPPVKPVSVPAGYKAAWDDGRLNPYAGAQTLTGALQTAQIWTQTTPRELKSGPSVNNYVLVQPSQYGRLKPYVSGPKRKVSVPTTVYPYPENVPLSRIYGTQR